ncbi:MAG: universal stress protein [Acetobacteraceae bacterium]|nr:universal stress protein [Acetobacteraceae bacterium]
MRLDVAARLAARHGAHLSGLFVVDIPLPMIMDASGGGGVLASLIEDMRAAALGDAAAAEAAFRARCERDGIAHEWRVAEGMTAEHVTLAARYADLVVLGQADPEAAEGGAAMPLDDVIFFSGRPVLVVPYAGTFGDVGRRVLVGWKAGREASRAVHDALPLLAAAEKVTVLSVNPGGPADHLPGAAICRHLARHGITAEASRLDSAEVADGDVLLNAAADLGADLLVAGAYGHSRLRELVLGGVTRTLLQRMTLPVLFSH